MTILPLYAAPQFAEQAIDWIWRAFGDGLPREFFQSVIDHSQTPGALPLTFIAVEDERLLGTVGLWRCDLITRQDLYPWLAALYVDEATRGEASGACYCVCRAGRVHRATSVVCLPRLLRTLRLAVHWRWAGIPEYAGSPLPLFALCFCKRRNGMTAHQRRAEQMRNIRRLALFSQR